VLEGQDATCGELIEWLIDGIGLISKPAEVDQLAVSVPDSNNVYMVPAFTGLRFPYWDPYARGTLVGLARDTKKAHIMRAVLEGIGFRVQDFLSVMSSDTKIPVKYLQCDGGVSKSDYLLQFIADITGATVQRGPSTDMTAIGAAMLAGLGIGYWKDLDELRKTRKIATEFTPKMEPALIKEKLARWQKAISSAMGWAIDIRSSKAPRIEPSIIKAMVEPPWWIKKRSPVLENSRPSDHIVLVSKLATSSSCQANWVLTQTRTPSLVQM